MKLIFEATCLELEVTKLREISQTHTTTAWCLEYTDAEKVIKKWGGGNSIVATSGQSVGREERWRLVKGGQGQ